MSHSVTLGWNSDPDAIGGYNVYRGSYSGAETTLLNSSPILITTFTDSSPMIGANYYVVKTIGADGTLAPSSNEVVYIPSAIYASLAGTSFVVAIGLNLAANLAGSGSSTAGLTGTFFNSSAIEGLGFLTGGINAAISGVVSGQGSVSANLVNGAIQGTISGFGLVSANLSGASSASIAGQGTVLASLKNTLVGVLSGVGTLTGVLSPPLKGVLAGSGSVVASVVGNLSVSATIFGSGSLVPSATVYPLIFGVLSGLGFVTGNLTYVSPVPAPNPFSSYYVLGDFGATTNNPAYVATNQNSFVLFAQPAFVPGNSPRVFVPPWNAFGTPNNFGYQGQVQLPGLLLVAPGTGSLNGKIYTVFISGTVIIPSSASGAGFTLVLNQNYLNFGAPQIADSLFIFTSPTGMQPGSYAFTLAASLAGNGPGTGVLSSGGIFTFNGAQYAGSGYSNRSVNKEPIIQLSCGVSFQGSVGGTDVFQASLTRFQLLQQPR